VAPQWPRTQRSLRARSPRTFLGAAIARSRQKRSIKLHQASSSSSGMHHHAPAYICDQPQSMLQTGRSVHTSESNGDGCVLTSSGPRCPPVSTATCTLGFCGPQAVSQNGPIARKRPQIACELGVDHGIALCFPIGLRYQIVMSIAFRWMSIVYQVCTYPLF